ncbi:MAG: hypothetical protein CMF48_05745 [Legionellales bacterium]|nr:hypothetical protein [Legionellales bacterium]|tara:strand:- start:987 stop:1409 length:423 start_codon:yes stop_codon:yes gene_type:complete
MFRNIKRILDGANAVLTKVHTSRQPQLSKYLQSQTQPNMFIPAMEHANASFLSQFKPYPRRTASYEVKVLGAACPQKLLNELKGAGITTDGDMLMHAQSAMRPNVLSLVTTDPNLIDELDKLADKNINHSTKNSQRMPRG